MDLLIQQLHARINSGLPVVDCLLGDAQPIPPPVALSRLAEIEELLGLHLPEQLKSLYLHVGNGNFGPGYGLFPVPLGEPDFIDLVGVYWYLCGDARQPDPNKFFDASKVGDLEPPEADEESLDVEDDGPAFTWQWPRHLLPILSHGCGTYECLDCKSPECAMLLHDPDRLTAGGTVDDTLILLSLSLEQRLEAWLRGEDPLARSRERIANPGNFRLQ